MEIKLTKEEKIVCKVLHFAIKNKHGACDTTNLNVEDEAILKDFEEKGYLHTDIDCIVITKEFKEFLDTLFGGNENERLE